MSVCFYNNRGLMVAVDPHEYRTANLVLHAVAGAMFQPATNVQRTPRVTADGWQMIQEGHDLLMQTHVPVTPPKPKVPGPPGLVLVATEWALICAFASSKADFKIRKVSGQGKSLAACVRGEVGLNTNCAGYGPFSFIFGYVWNPNSVVTQPTIGDYVSWLTNLGLSSLLDHGVSKGLDKKVRGPKKFRNHVKKEIAKQLVKWVPWLAKQGDVWTPAELPGDIGDLAGDLADSIGP